MAGPTFFCYDASDDATEAIRAAGRAIGGGPALVATVWRPVTADHLAASVPGFSGMLHEAVGEMDAAARAKAEELAQEGCKIASEAGFDAEPLTLEAGGAIWAALVHAAEEHDAPVVVVGRRGQSRIAAALLGSVSSGVLSHAGRPVLVVPAARD